MRLGIGIGVCNVRAAGGEAAFTPASLFASGEDGVWFEPSPTTAFASPTDLTPCAVGDTCGFLLDKSKGAEYSGGGFIGTGSELVSNGTFDVDISGWSSARGASLSLVANKLQVTGTDTSFPYAYTQITTEVGKTYIVKVDCTFVSGSDGGVSVDKSDAEPTNTNVVSTGQHNASDIPDLVFTATSTTTYIRLVTNNTTDVNDWDNISVKELPGNHATQGTLASRPILRQTGGGLYYLEFDGTDDAMETAAIDFSASDKMSIFAGVTKNGDSVSMIAELSGNYSSVPNTGSFFLLAENLYGSPARGDATPSASFRANTAIFSGVDTAVITALHDISGDSSLIRRNGVASSPATGDKGAGNFGNYPIYTGSRGGTGLFFNGDLYSMIVRGATTSGDDLTGAESYVADKTGVTL